MTTQIARGNLLPPHRLLFSISSKGSFICIIPDRIIHTTAFVTPVMEHWLEREIAQWAHPMKDDRMTHRTISERSYHGATSCSRGMRERNVLFNDTLNTFYLWFYGVRHMVKDHSDSEKENPLPPHRLLLSINSNGSFICTIPQTG